MISYLLIMSLRTSINFDLRTTTFFSVNVWLFSIIRFAAFQRNFFLETLAEKREVNMKQHDSFSYLSHAMTFRQKRIR